MDKNLAYFLSHKIATDGSFKENIRRLTYIDNLLLSKGYKVINPYLITSSIGLNDQEHREKIMDICFALVKACDRVVICSKISMGMAKEIIVAEAHGVEVIPLEQILEFEGITL